MAAQDIQKGSPSLAARAILDLLRERLEGMTDHEIADVFPEMHPGSRVKRRTNLARAGHVVDTGLTRKIRYGRDGIVWRAVQ